MDPIIYKLNLGPNKPMLTNRGSNRPLNKQTGVHYPKNENLTRPLKTRDQIYKLGSPQTDVLRASRIQSLPQNSSSTSNVNSQPQPSTGSIVYYDLVLKPGDSTYIYNLLLENKLKFNINSIIMQFSNKCLKPGHRTEHWKKFIECAGMVNLSFFFENEQKNNFELNSLGKAYLKQASLLYAGLVFSFLLEKPITKVEKKEKQELSHYISKVAKNKVIDFDSEVVNLTYDSLIEFNNEDSVNYEMTLRAVFRIRRVKVENDDKRLILYMPTCFPAGNTRSFLNPKWNLEKTISRNEIMRRWEITKEIFKPTYLPDMLYDLYKKQNANRSDGFIYSRIRNELNLTPGNTYPAFEEVFPPIN